MGWEFEGASSEKKDIFGQETTRSPVFPEALETIDGETSQDGVVVKIVLEKNRVIVEMETADQFSEEGRRYAGVIDRKTPVPHGVHIRGDTMWWQPRMKRQGDPIPWFVSVHANGLKCQKGVPAQAVKIHALVFFQCIDRVG